MGDMQHIRFLPAGLFCIWLAALSAGCLAAVETDPPAPGMTTSAESTGANPDLTNLVGGILADYGWEGREVTLTGYYRGWDLLGEAGQSPPVTRSDWVIKDNGGAIYVRSSQVEIEGKDRLGSGESLDPGLKSSTSHVIRVTGVVRYTPKGQCYIEPTRLELIK
jgi:hypothetical protein